MKIQPISFKGYKCPRRMTMTPQKQKIHQKNIMITSAHDNKELISKIVYYLKQSLENNKYF